MDSVKYANIFRIRAKLGVSFVFFKARKINVTKIFKTNLIQYEIKLLVLSAQNENGKTVGDDCS